MILVTNCVFRSYVKAANVLLNGSDILPDTVKVAMNTVDFGALSHTHQHVGGWWRTQGRREAFSRFIRSPLAACRIMFSSNARIQMYFLLDL